MRACSSSSLAKFLHHSYVNKSLRVATHTPESTVSCSQETPNSLPTCISHHLVPFSAPPPLCISNMCPTIHCLVDSLTLTNLITDPSLVTSSALSHEHTRTCAHMATFYLLLPQLIQLAQARPHDAMHLPSIASFCTHCMASCYRNRYISIYIYIYTSIEARLWQASLLWRAIDSVSAEVL